MPHASVLRVGVCIMPKGLKRYYGDGHLHFLTFSCYRRLPLLNTLRARNLFVHTLGKIRERYKFLLVGYVVMPNHVHLLISEPKEATPSVVLKVLKQRVSRICGERDAVRRQGNWASRLQKVSEICHDSGSPDSMTSMFGAKRNFARSSTICTGIRLRENWWIIPKIGRGAVGRSMRMEKPG